MLLRSSCASLALLCDLLRSLQAAALLSLLLVSTLCAAGPPNVNSQTKQLATPSTILVLGDSLSAEYGLPRGQGWVKLLETKLFNENPQRKLQWVNASISGETTAGGLSRFNALFAKHQPQIVLLELGGNDALRGLALSATENNLSQIIQRSQQQGAQVILLGTKIPPNYGKAYSENYFALFPKLQKKYTTGLVHFLMAGFADQRNYLDFFQADGIHPNAAAQAIMAQNVYPALIQLLDKPRRSNSHAPPNSANK